MIDIIAYDLQKNLFEEYTVLKYWGGLKNRLGGSTLEMFNSQEEANQEIIAIIKKRLKRKYLLV